MHPARMVILPRNFRRRGSSMDDLSKFGHGAPRGGGRLPRVSGPSPPRLVGDDARPGVVDRAAVLRGGPPAPFFRAVPPIAVVPEDEGGAVATFAGNNRAVGLHDPVQSVRLSRICEDQVVGRSGVGSFYLQLHGIAGH